MHKPVITISTYLKSTDLVFQPKNYMKMSWDSTFEHILNT
jgi:hypothetical protein